jgi:hypothetical protein
LAIAPLERASSCPKTMGSPTELTEFHGKERWEGFAGLGLPGFPDRSLKSVSFDAFGV